MKVPSVLVVLIGCAVFESVRCQVRNIRFGVVTFFHITSVTDARNANACSYATNAWSNSFNGKCLLSVLYIFLTEMVYGRMINLI